MVGEVGNEVEAPAEGLDVAGDGLDGGQFAALDLGDSARGNTYDLGELSMTRSGHDPDPIVRVFSPNRYTKNGGAKSGKTLADHRADRKNWLTETVGTPTPDPDRYTWEPVDPADRDYME